MSLLECWESTFSTWEWKGSQWYRNVWPLPTLRLLFINQSSRCQEWPHLRRTLLAACCRRTARNPGGTGWPWRPRHRPLFRSTAPCVGQIYPRPSRRISRRRAIRRRSSTWRRYPGWIGRRPSPTGGKLHERAISLPTVSLHLWTGPQPFRTKLFINFK